MAMASAMAQQKIVVEGADGSKLAELPLEQIKKVVFPGNGTLEAQLADGTSTGQVPLSGISKIYFADVQTSINSVADKAGRKVVYDGKTITIPEIKSPVRAEVYTLDGSMVESRNQWDGRSYDVSALPKGAYILKAGKVAVKFVK